MRRTIREILFDGYEDTVMDIGSSLDSDDDYFEEGEYEDDDEEDLNKVPMDKFGWFYKVSILHNKQSKSQPADEKLNWFQYN